MLVTCGEFSGLAASSEYIRPILSIRVMELMISKGSYILRIEFILIYIPILTKKQTEVPEQSSLQTDILHWVKLRRRVGEWEGGGLRFLTGPNRRKNVHIQFVTFFIIIFD